MPEQLILPMTQGEEALAHCHDTETMLREVFIAYLESQEKQGGKDAEPQDQTEPSEP